MAIETSIFPTTFRRLVTGHDQQGNSVVWQDHQAEPVRVCPPGTPLDARTVRVTELWQTTAVPADNSGSEDIAREVTKTGALASLHQANGAVFRAVDFPPNHGDRSHRTESVDFAVVISGEIYMELEPGNEVLLRAGDTVVQRGTIHKWINRSDQYTRLIFVLVGADSIKIKGNNIREAEYGLDK